MPNVKTVQTKLTMPESDTEQLEKLSDNTGLSKSILVKLMLNGTLRDMQTKPYESGAGSLILAWCSKTPETALADIEVW